MAGASRQETARAAAFELERIEAVDGRLVVAGRWSGVRGMRFVRPALVMDDRELLAVLEHKPWAPDSDPWIAAFPWDGGEIDVDTLSLAVAPSVVVPLGDAPAAESEPLGAPDHELAVARLENEVRFLRDERRDELDQARRDATRERENLQAQLDEAIADREAAVRTRARMEARAEEADEHRRAAEEERDDALEHLAELRAHLDEVLLANRTLQQKLQAELASDAPPEPRDYPKPPPVRPGDDDEPIGVRAIPAARVASPHLDRALRARDVGASRFDVIAIRVLGIAAAICFILLLVMFIRIFI
jgi:hypothetical protein